MRILRQCFSAKLKLSRSWTSWCSIELVWDMKLLEVSVLIRMKSRELKYGGYEEVPFVLPSFKGF